MVTGQTHRLWIFFFFFDRLSFQRDFFSFSNIYLCGCMCACSIYYIFLKISDECVNVCVASSFGEMASDFLAKFGVVGKTSRRDPGLRFFFFF